MQIKQPKYQIIAQDIAAKIVEKKYIIGEKIYARSTLASQYNVSAETARRAIAMLQDLNIVEAMKGSGVVIVSYENAAKFVHRFEEGKTVRELQKDIHQQMDRQAKEFIQLRNMMDELIDHTNRFTSANPFIPFQIDIEEHCLYLSQNVGEIHFWQNTGATIVGIMKNNTMLLSPGPYATLEKGDTLFFIGEESCFQNVARYLYN